MVSNNSGWIVRETQLVNSPGWTLWCGVKDENFSLLSIVPVALECELFTGVLCTG